MTDKNTKLTVEFSSEPGDEKETLSVFWDGLPVFGGQVQTEVFKTESPEIKEKLLKISTSLLEPLFKDPVIAEGTVFQDGLEPVFEKLRWLGPELAEEY